MREEIGGYLELERFSGPVLHGEALALSSGRACLSFLICRKGIRKILLPDFLCDVVAKACEHYGVSVRRYRIGPDLRPLDRQELRTEDGEWLYLVNYYGQLSQEELLKYADGSTRVIVDNAQAYFEKPVPGLDTLYTCRKFLGVADGAFLYTDAADTELPRDESRARMGFVLGRFERPAGEYYADAARNNEELSVEPRRMSDLTWNLLHAVDYDRIRRARTENFSMLHEALGSLNLLDVRTAEGAYAYPLMLKGGREIRRRLIEQKIFVPMLWPNTREEQPENTAARRLAEDILPLPCDQRYGAEEMAFIIQAVRNCLQELQEKRS